MRTVLFNQFVNAINTHDLDAIEALISADPTFIDANGNKTVGREEVIAMWKNYFAFFPDYLIEIEKELHHASTLAVFGFVSGSYSNAAALATENHWKATAAWKVIIEESKIKLWQIFTDTKVEFDILAKHNNNANLNQNKINGLGGIFFKSKNTKELCAWYDKHLGTNFGANTYTTFKWRERNTPAKIGRTEFSIFSEKSEYFAPSKKSFMLNFRVSNLDALLDKLKSEGVTVDDKIERLEYGNFGWIIDLEGNKIELWEPVDKVLEDYEEQK